MVSLSVKLAMTYAVRLINEKKGLDRTFQVKEDPIPAVQASAPSVQDALPKAPRTKTRAPS
jgi:hypothetical protein